MGRASQKVIGNVPPEFPALLQSGSYGAIVYVSATGALTRDAGATAMAVMVAV